MGHTLTFPSFLSPTHALSCITTFDLSVCQMTLRYCPLFGAGHSSAMNIGIEDEFLKWGILMKQGFQGRVKESRDCPRKRVRKPSTLWAREWQWVGFSIAWLLNHVTRRK